MTGGELLLRWISSMKYDPCSMGVHDFDPQTWTCRKCGVGVNWINQPPAKPAEPKAMKDYTPADWAHRAIRIASRG